jgi:hypothetical protein
MRSRSASVCARLRARFTELHFRWRSLDLTKPEVLANCEDLKVLGKGDFKALIRWRTALREEVYRHCEPLIKIHVFYRLPPARFGCQNKTHRGAH